VFSARHEQLIVRYEDGRQPSWADEALHSCLVRLRDGGPTEWESVTVVDAWTEGDSLSVAYEWTYLHETIGCRRSRPENATAAAEFGIETADFFIAEPLGTRYDALRFDANGIGWWGDLPEEEA
jgi:hypothetical protein